MICYIELNDSLCHNQCGQVALHGLSPSTSRPHKLVEIGHLPITAMAGHVVVAVPLLGADRNDLDIRISDKP